MIIDIRFLSNSEIEEGGVRDPPSSRFYQKQYSICLKRFKDFTLNSPHI